MGQRSWFGHLTARAAASQLTTFVVPDGRIARLGGLDLEAAGLCPVATPRHARVLLVVREMPTGLLEAAAVVYAQMPRPRLILAAGTRELLPLPDPDVTVSLDQGSLVEGVAALRKTFAAGAWSPGADAFAVAVIEPDDDEDDDSGEEMDHAGMDHGNGNDESSGDESGHQGMNHGGGKDESGGEEDGGGESGHESMDHGDMDFMSMVAMTKDLPRDRDGLPMERVEAPLGPLFRGLPAGLCLTFTLDGDDVVATTASAEPVQRDVMAALSGPAATFPDRLARLQPLDPMSWWLVGRTVLDTVAGAETSEVTRRAYAAELERARAASHLGWLSEFAWLLGDRWLHHQASSLQQDALRINDNDLDAVRAVRSRTRSLVAGFDRLGIVRRRLSGLAVIKGEMSVPGPVGRASGVANDARSSDPVYQALGFSSVTRDEGDVYARLRLRLDEVIQSFDLILAAGTMTTGSPPVARDLSGTGRTTIETSRGAAMLDLTVVDGQVTGADWTAPSSQLLELVSAVTKEAEVGDALIGVASLDLSPWEIVEPVAGGSR